MTKKEKGQIELLRTSGYSYGEIAKMLTLTRSTVTNYCLRQQIVPPDHVLKIYSLCPNCRNLFSPEGRQRNNQRFCSEQCRKDYWRKERHSKEVLEVEAEHHLTLQKELDFLPEKSDEWVDGEEILLRHCIQPITTMKGG